MTTPLIRRTFSTPAGDMQVVARGDTVYICDWLSNPHRERNVRRVTEHLACEIVDGTSPVIDELLREVDEYFAGCRRSFDVTIATVGTPLQRSVWQALLMIPYGERWSYTLLAERVGKPRAVRAVASAVGANPLSLILPCHRVVGANGALCGYAGGLVAKQILLQIEAQRDSRCCKSDRSVE